MTDELRKKLKRVFRKHLLKPELARDARPELRPGFDEYLKIAVDTLSNVGTEIARGPVQVPIESYRQIGRAATRKELDKLAKLADAIIEHVKTLHEPAILALADRGVMRSAILDFSQELSHHAHHTDVDGVPMIAGRGRPSNNLANVVAGVVVRNFEKLTGGRIDLPGQSAGVVALVGDIFEALNIQANAHAAVRAVLDLQSLGQNNNPPNQSH